MPNKTKKKQNTESYQESILRNVPTPVGSGEFWNWYCDDAGGGGCTGTGDDDEDMSGTGGRSYP